MKRKIALSALFVVALFTVGCGDKSSSKKMDVRPSPTPLTAQEKMDLVKAGRCMDEVDGLVVTQEVVDAAVARKLSYCDFRKLNANAGYITDSVITALLDSELRSDYVMRVIPATYWTQETTRKRLADYPGIFGFLPETFQTKSNFDFAAMNGLLSLEDIPIKSLDESGILRVIANHDGSDDDSMPYQVGKDVLSIFDEDNNYASETAKIITERIALAAVSKDGDGLRYVPREKKTWAVCLAAMKQSDDALRYVPPYLLATHGQGKLALQQKAGE